MLCDAFAAFLWSWPWPFVAVWGSGLRQLEGWKWRLEAVAVWFCVLGARWRYSPFSLAGTAEAAGPPSRPGLQALAAFRDGPGGFLIVEARQDAASDEEVTYTAFQIWIVSSVLGFTCRLLRARYWDVLVDMQHWVTKVGVATRSVQDLRPPSKRPRPSIAPRLRQAGTEQFCYDFGIWYSDLLLQVVKKGCRDIQIAWDFFFADMNTYTYTYIYISVGC